MEHNNTIPLVQDWETRDLSHAGSSESVRYSCLYVLHRCLAAGERLRAVLVRTVQAEKKRLWTTL